MLNEGVYEEDNEEENSINPKNNDENIEKAKNNNKKSTEASTYSDKEALKIDKEEKEEKKKNKKEEFQEEKEVDQITELVEKYKSILMKIPGEDREDALIYGLKAIYLQSKNKIKNGTVFCDDETYLQFLCPDNLDNIILFKIKLASISDIIIGRSNGYLKDIELPIEENSCITIKYNDGLMHVDLIFKRTDLCEMFLSGLISVIRNKVREGLTYDSDLISLKRIWRQYNTEPNKYLNIEQFSQFLKHINFDLKDKGPEKIFKDIGKKDNDRITFKEFISFYELLVTGEEFAEIFQKYSTDENKKYITIKGLIEFFDKEQNQILYPEDAIKLICKFSNKARKTHKSALEVIETLIKSKKITIKNNSKNNNNSEDSFDENLSNFMNILTNDLFNMKRGGQKVNPAEITESESMIKDYENHTLDKSRKLYDILNNGNILNNEYKEIKEIKKQLKQTLQLSFRKFVNLLIDRTINNVFNKEKILRTQDMDHPMTDYFVNSSHNTYLDGNQIIGNSSIAMYPYVLDNGTRFVDLDTFDNREEENEPVITHWHFPVGSIPFKDTLIAIKNSAFQKNNYPVILSLENHCGDVCQEKMQNYFLSIIGRENLYILDSKTPPLQYPSPNQLKNKFIIKNKRKRIFGDLAEMKSSYEKLYITTIEQNRKKNENSILMNKNNSISTEQHTNINNTNNIQKQKQIMNKYLRKDINNNNKDLKDNLENEIIEEENSESISSESDVSEKADEKIENEFGRIVNKVRTHTYSFIKQLNNPNFILCNHTELSFVPENINIQTMFKRNKKKLNTNKLKITEAKYELPRIIPLSKLALKKISERISINDEIESFPPDNSIVELEEKGKALKKLQDIQNEDSKKNSNKIKIITIENLANILGMVGVKYHKETFDPYQFLPWECISICENDILKYISVMNNKYKIMEYCKTSFLKIYPDGFRTDSSNQNVIECWALGCQFCALNLQKTDDDCALINKMFFKLNGGSKCGYVLKPRWLREFNEETFKKKALHPSYKIKFEILSGFHLHMTIPSGKKIKGMFVEVTFRSPNLFFEREKEEKEPKLTTSVINKNFLHPVFPSNCITFNVYEEELSFIFIKLFSENKDICLGRAVIPIVALNLGYRVVDLYDNTCSKLDEPYLIVKSNKIL